MHSPPSIMSRYRSMRIESAIVSTISGGVQVGPVVRQHPTMEFGAQEPYRTYV